MPIISEDEFLKQVPTRAADKVLTPTATPESNAPTTWETIGAAFNKSNLLINLGQKFLDPHEDSPFDPNYSVFANGFDKIKGYEQYAERFLGTNSDADVEHIKFKIDYEREQQDILDRSDSMLSSVSSIAASVADPLIFVPLIKGISTASRGAAALKGVAQGAGFSAAAVSAQEAGLQFAQETRSKEESIINVLGATALGGILGGSIAALTGVQREAGEAVLKAALKGEDIPFDPSVGAAKVSTDISGEGLAKINSGIAKAIAGLGIPGITPVTIRGVTSPFGVVRALTNKLFNHNMLLGKHLEGIARGEIVENGVRRWHASDVELNKKVSQLYFNHTGKGALGSTLARPEGKLSYAEFQTRIAKALNDPTYVDDVAEVMEAAKINREHLNKVADELVNSGVFKEPIPKEKLNNYLTRVYDREKLLDPIIKNNFLTKISRYFKSHGKDGDVVGAALDDDVAMQLATETYDNIIGQSDSALAFTRVADQVKSKGSFTKERTIDLPYSELEEFLITDASQIISNYTKRAGSLIELQKGLKDLGYSTLEDLKQSLKLEKDTAIKGKSKAEIIKLEYKFGESLELVDDMYKLMAGQLRKPGMWDRQIETLLHYQFVRLLGGVTISSLSDLAMAPLRFGLTRALRDGYFPLIRSIADSNLGAAQMRRLDIGLENEMSNVLLRLTEEGLGEGRKLSTYDKSLSLISDTFAKLTGITYWTQMGRRISSNIAAVELADNLMKAKPSQKIITDLARFGIGTDMSGRVAAQISKWSEKRHGSFIPNWDLWTDKEAQRAFMNAIQNKVESTVIRPSKGDVPFFAQRNLFGKLVWQFKSFASAASSRITIAGLQDRDAKTLTGILGLVALGSMSYVLKEKVAGREPNLDPTNLILEGLDRSGVLGLMGGTILQTSRSLTNDQYRHYAGQRVLSAFTGPSIAQIKDLTDTIAKFTDGKASEKDVKAALKMMPFMNLFYLQWLINQAFPNKSE